MQAQELREKITLCVIDNELDKALALIMQHMPHVCNKYKLPNVAQTLYVAQQRLRKARELFASHQTTETEYQAERKSIGSIVLHLSQEFKDQVEITHLDIVKALEPLREDSTDDKLHYADIVVAIRTLFKIT